MYSFRYDWPGFLAHEHYVWHSTRPRTKQGTVELRAACQQPWSEHMAATALQLGLVEAMTEIQVRKKERDNLN
jgi:gamma-glutamylcysteine synthetase